MGFRILIVDDEKLSRRYVRAMIAEFEPTCSVLEAEVPESALAVLNAESIDILFLDIMMPGMDGFQMLQQIENRDFELVFLTAYNQFAIAALRQGAADYLLKPIRKSDFKQLLQKVLARRREKLDYVAYVESLEKTISAQKRGVDKQQEVLHGILETQILTEDDWSSFRERFDIVHPAFLLRLRERYPVLTQAEIRLMALSKLRLATREMASMLGVSPETIRQTRWRLKKKIELEDDQDLNDLVNSI